MRLWPMTRRERLGLGSTGVCSELLALTPSRWPDFLRGQSAPGEAWEDAALRGGFPEPAYEIDDPMARELWFRGYVATYHTRDLRRISSKPVSQEDAIAEAIPEAQARRSEVVIHRPDGRIQDSDSYGHDPESVRDSKH